jgi:alpha-beta hydrolase superfamily lysophospholipase
MAELVGTDVLYRRWDVPNPRAVLLLVHGLGAHSARWGFLAEYFTARGIASYAVELTGFGRSSARLRGHVDSYRVWDREVLALRGIIENEYPGRKVFLLGESLGGLLAFNLAGRYPDLFAGQILISPAFQNGLKFPLRMYLALPFNLAVRPRKTIPVPFTAAMCTRDAAYQEVMNGNPDEVRVASLKLLFLALGEQLTARKYRVGSRVPALFLVAGLDQLVGIKAEFRQFRKLRLIDKTLREYPDYHHALSIESGRERVFAHIHDWLEPRV